MSGFLEKFKIKTAIETSTTLDLSCQHVTTSDFMELQPVYIKEMVPGEKLTVHQSTFTRLAPLAVPTLGNANIHNRAFFIPMRTIFPRWDEFITQSESSRSVQIGSTNVSMCSTPLLSNDAIVRMFLGNSTNGAIITTTAQTKNGLTEVIDSGDTAATANADIVASIVPNNASAYTQIMECYYNLTPYGRQLLKIFQSLGYSPIWTATYDTGSTSGMNAVVKAEYLVESTYSALPLFAFFKLFIDWYWPSQYVGDTHYNYVDSVLRYDGYNGSADGVSLTWKALLDLFKNASPYGATGTSPKFTVNYDADYLVSAFDTPVGKMKSWTQASRLAMKDITLYPTSDGGEYDTNIKPDDTEHTYQTPVIEANSWDASSDEPDYTFNGVISQYAIDALKAMTDFMQRHNLVGVRALDRFYARFGIKLSSEKLRRSNYIGSQNVPLQFGDVMSNSDTDGAALGAYAGKGLGYGEQTFEYSSDDYGFFVICSSIVPVADTFEGIDRMVLHKNATDFWTPEFDQLGNQAISKMEVYVPLHDSANELGTHAIEFNNNTLANGIFGFTPRYSEYKVGRSKVTGDFRCKSLSNVGDTSSAWYLNRSHDGRFIDSYNIAHGINYVTGWDAEQYNRIFNVESNQNDKFYLIHNFDVKSESPMRSLYDTYDFDGGKTVVGDVNGVKVN